MGVIPPDYIIEIRDPDGDLIGILKDASDIILTEGINTPKTLTFILPANDFRTPDITRANELWIRKVDIDTIIAKFRLLRKEDRR